MKRGAYVPSTHKIIVSVQVIFMCCLLFILFDNVCHETNLFYITGNLCRCTGYRPIIEGFRCFTEDWEQNQAMYSNGLSNGLTNVNGCAMGDQCCKMKVNGVAANGVCKQDDELLFNKTEYTPYDPSQEPIFPPELRVCIL